MRHATTVFVLVLAMVMLTGTSCQKQVKEEPEALVETEEWVLPDSLVSEQVWLYFVDKPEECFDTATTEFDAGDLKGASYELRTAAAYMKIEGVRARGTSKKGLKASIDEIERTAEQIEDGVVVPEGIMDSMFARAHYALAEHHYQRASALWEKDEVKAGMELDASLVHAGHAMGWLPGETEEASTTIFKPMRETAGEMTEGKLVGPETVRKTLVALGDELAALRVRLEPAY